MTADELTHLHPSLREPLGQLLRHPDEARAHEKHPLHLEARLQQRQPPVVLIRAGQSAIPRFIPPLRTESR